MNQAFESLEIVRYRGFKAISLSDLGKVNIFVGDNNSGKTSLLEAISILCNPLDPFQWIEIAYKRLLVGKPIGARPDLEAIKWIFPQQQGEQTDDFFSGNINIKSTGSAPICELKANLQEFYATTNDKNSIDLQDSNITSSDNDAVQRGAELEIIADLIYKNPALLDNHSLESRKDVFQFLEQERFTQRKRNKPLVQNATISPLYASLEPLSDRLSKIILKSDNGTTEVVRLLQLFDENISDIQIVTKNNKGSIYIKHEKLGFTPLYVFGDGLKRSLIICLTLLSISNGVLLIDEIETSIHVSALDLVFSWLIKICSERKIQLFVTTHSLEAVDAMLQPGINEENIVAFRLNLNGQQPQRFYGNLLHRLRSERGIDVR